MGNYGVMWRDFMNVNLFVLESSLYINWQMMISDIITLSRRQVSSRWCEWSVIHLFLIGLHLGLLKKIIGGCDEISSQLQKLIRDFFLLKGGWRWDFSLKTSSNTVHVIIPLITLQCHAITVAHLCKDIQYC